ncbi:unnamed protein product [Peniophora sp. CBMAI 1063]|nr:unnamed protein product [Peniophora sp. CBMAI 1063]
MGAHAKCAFGKYDVDEGAVDLREFVIEVLKHSPTTVPMLQTALCYVKAIRAEIVRLAASEAAGCCRRDADQRMLVALAAGDADVEKDFGPISPPYGSYQTARRGLTPSVEYHLRRWLDQGNQADSLTTATSLNLPSPLLDPRRTFIAALVLASKFLHDRCYSNRPWAKLAALHPRELGRCERAICDALDWRLWVGKPPA